MLLADRMKPRKDTSEEWNSHFSAFTKSWFCSRCRTAVEVDEHKLVNYIVEHILNQTLMAGEHCFPLISLSDPDQVVGITKVQFGIIAIPLKFCLLGLFSALCSTLLMCISVSPAGTFSLGPQTKFFRYKTSIVYKWIIQRRLFNHCSPWRKLFLGPRGIFRWRAEQQHCIQLC